MNLLLLLFLIQNEILESLSKLNVSIWIEITIMPLCSQIVLILVHIEQSVHRTAPTLGGDECRNCLWPRFSRDHTQQPNQEKLFKIIYFFLSYFNNKINYK